MSSPFAWFADLNVGWGTNVPIESGFMIVSWSRYYHQANCRRTGPVVVSLAQLEDGRPDSGPPLAGPWRYSLSVRVPRSLTGWATIEIRQPPVFRRSGPTGGCRSWNSPVAAPPACQGLLTLLAYAGPGRRLRTNDLTSR